MGGRTSSSGMSSNSGPITDVDWMNWAEDPTPFQAAINGEPMPNISMADGHRYTEQELDRARKVAPMIQSKAESGTVNEDTLYRGEVFDSLLEARRKYKVGATITNDKLTSYTRRKNTAVEYASSSGEGVKVVIQNTSTRGRSVGVMTDPFGIGGSDEVISPKGLKSKVKSTKFDRKTDTLYVYLENSAKPKNK